MLMKSLESECFFELFQLMILKQNIKTRFNRHKLQYELKYGLFIGENVGEIGSCKSLHQKGAHFY